MESVHEIVRKAEANYLNGKTRLGEYVEWSMHDTIERIDAYLNSKHVSGPVDSLGREKPFFDIVSAIVNIWFRATDIDRKDIRFVPRNNAGVLLSFVANVILQDWMDRNRFGQFLNAWGRALARYGGSVVEFVEKRGDLVPGVVPWNRYIADPVQFDALPNIKKLYYTPAQLRKMPYDQDLVTELIEAKETRKTLDRKSKDAMDDFIEVYEVHGELDSRLLKDRLTRRDQGLAPGKVTYRQQMHVISYVKKGREFTDFTLFKGKERGEGPMMMTALIEEDGRTLPIGAVEHAFEAQWMENHTAKNMKDTLDLASRMIFQSADPRFADRNVLTAIETGDILQHAPNMPLTRVGNDSPSIQALIEFGNMWKAQASDATSTPDAMKGIMGSGKSNYRAAALAVQQASSLFELMTENKGLAIEDMLRRFVIPYIKRCLKNKDEVVAILDASGVSEIDGMYVPHAAARAYNRRVGSQLLDMKLPEEDDEGMEQKLYDLPVPSPYMKDDEEAKAKDAMSRQGNRRFLVPDDIGEKEWSDVFAGFDWDNVRVQVTDENGDQQKVLEVLNNVFSTLAQVAANGGQMTDDQRMVFNAILEETGKISPLQFQSAKTAAAPPAQTPTEEEQPARTGAMQAKVVPGTGA